MDFSKFFSNTQEAPWYRSFLNPVINEITEGKLLDIGTGSGKLVQILSTEKEIDCIGIDTNANMLNEARIKLKKTNVKLYKIKADTKLSFKESSFDYITICNVLFHLKKDSINIMLNNAQELIKDSGKIIILTPTGKNNNFTLTKHFSFFKNFSIYIWFFATKKKAKKWINVNYLKQYANDKNLNYKSKTVMNGLAQLEIITIK